MNVKTKKVMARISNNRIVFLIYPPAYTENLASAV